MDVENCMKKFRLLLKSVFDGKLVLTNDHIEKLIKILGDCSDDKPAKRLLETPSFSDLIIQSLENIHDASDSVKLLIIQIITLLFKNELQFSKMQMQVLQNINNLNSASLAYLQLSLSNLATAQICHCTGLNFILDHKLWQRRLNPDVCQKPFPVSRAAFHFIAKLVWRLDECDLETELLEIMNFIIKPIRETEYKSLQVLDLETEKVLADKILPYVNALLAILSETDKIVTQNKVVHMVMTLLFYDTSIYTTIATCRYPELLYSLNACVLRFNIAQYTNLLWKGKSEEFCATIVAIFRNTLIEAIQKRELKVIIQIVVQWIITMSEFVKSFKARGLPYKSTFQRNGKQLELPDQMTLHLAIPLLIYANVLSPTNTETGDLREVFRTKLGKTISEHIYSCCYLFKRVVERSDIKQSTIQTLKELFSLKGCLTETQAGVLFQSLYYVLEKFIPLDRTGGFILNENAIRCPDEDKLLTLLLEVIKMLLLDHNISWYENFEIINLQAGLMNLLKQKTLTNKQIVKTLDLIDICVKKFLSPSMSLLVESRQDSTLNEIGAVMKIHIQHPDWEIRDSALNLLYTCTDISFIKYIPLQKVIRESNLIILGAKVALTDEEYYAQCTALRCVAAASRIESIWREVLMDNPHFYLQLLYILRNNPEGMVRMEAAAVLTKVYNNQKLTQRFKSNLYEAMLTAALDDLHWEVQLSALNFWKHVIRTHMINRGMIDGKFPTVTFSKEKRKIITLNESEIIRQLTCVMDELSSIGCLTVLLECMDEVNHTEVMEKAYILTKDLIETLDKYKFGYSAEDVTIFNHINEEKELKTKQEIKVEQMIVDLTIDDSIVNERDKAIDSILELSQAELLMNLHDSYIETKCYNMDEQFATQIHHRKFVRSNQFLKECKTKDYLSRINQKKTWHTKETSLEEMLDDILELAET